MYNFTYSIPKWHLVYQVRAGNIASLAQHTWPVSPAANYSFISHSAITHPFLLDPVWSKTQTRKEGKNSRKHISSAPLARSIGSQAFYGLCVWAWQAGADCVGHGGIAVNGNMFSNWLLTLFVTARSGLTAEQHRAAGHGNCQDIAKWPHFSLWPWHNYRHIRPANQGVERTKGYTRNNPWPSVVSLYSKRRLNGEKIK